MSPTNNRCAPPTLLRCAEFEAHDVTLLGDLAFEVPDGHRLLVTAGEGGGLNMQLQPLLQPTWHWQYSMGGADDVQLQLVEHR